METGRQVAASASDEAVVLQRARIISGALMGGVATFAGVAAFLVLQGTMGDPLPEGARRYLPVAFVAAFAIVLVAPLLGKTAGRAARTHTDAFLVGTLVSMAMREGAGLAGIVFSLLAGRVEWVLAFAALSLVAMGWGWPREDSLREAARQQPR